MRLNSLITKMSIPTVIVFIGARRITQHSISFRPDKWLLLNAVATSYILLRWPRSW